MMFALGQSLTPLILNDYPGAGLGFSVYKIDNMYSGACIKVRRTDNTELDIGFNGNLLDTTALASFVGGGDGYVTTWYDQSGSGINATQTSPSLQPIIMQSGVLNQVNSLVSLNFDNRYMTFSSVTLNSTWSVFSVGKKFIAANIYAPLSGAVSTPSALLHFSDSNYYIIRQGSYDISNSTDSNVNQMLLTGIAKASTQDIWRDGSLITSTANSLTINNNLSQIGRYATSVGAANISEIIFYNSDQDSNRTGIEANIKSRFTSIP